MGDIVCLSSVEKGESKPVKQSYHAKNYIIKLATDHGFSISINLPLKDVAALAPVLDYQLSEYARRWGMLNYGANMIPSTVDPCYKVMEDLINTIILSYTNLYNKYGVKIITAKIESVDEE